MPRTRRPIGQSIFAQVLGFVCCVGLPVFVSMIAPISVVRFVREDERVTAHVSTRVFYAIPYRRLRIEDVRGVDDRYHAGEIVRRAGFDASGGQREHRSESESFLVIHGRTESAEVSVSPVNIRSAVEKTRDFLANPGGKDLRITTVANWKFSVFIPLLLSPLTVLYVVGVVLTVGRLFDRRKQAASD